MSLKGKVCVVTGASSGIGRQTALDLAADGARVCVAARREDRLVELLAEIGGESAGHSYVVVDVTDRDRVRELAGHVERTYGRLDVLINNAGAGANRIFDGPEAIPELERMLAVNFLGAAYCTAEMLHLLTASAPSNIVNVASVAGRIAFGGSSSYCAAKFALVGWSESLYYDLYGQGVCVSTVEPGFIQTEGFPQKDIVNDPVLRHTMGTTEGVSSAIRNAIARRRMQRSTPRFYYLLQVPRIVAPPLVRLIQRKLIAPRQNRRRDNGYA